MVSYIFRQSWNGVTIIYSKFYRLEKEKQERIINAALK